MKTEKEGRERAERTRDCEREHIGRKKRRSELASSRQDMNVKHFFSFMPSKELLSGRDVREAGDRYHILSTHVLKPHMSGPSKKNPCLGNVAARLLLRNAKRNKNKEEEEEERPTSSHMERMRELAKVSCFARGDMDRIPVDLLLDLLGLTVKLMGKKSSEIDDIVQEIKAYAKRKLAKENIGPLIVSEEEAVKKKKKKQPVRKLRTITDSDVEEVAPVLSLAEAMEWPEF